MKTTNLNLTDEYIISRHLGFAIVVKASAKLPSEGFCSWSPENRSVAHNVDRRPHLRNPALVEILSKVIEAQSERMCVDLDLHVPN